MFKKALIVLVVVFGLMASVEAAQMKVRVAVSTQNDFLELLPLNLDIVYIKQGEFVDVFVNENEYRELQKQGFVVEMLIPDLEKYYTELMGGRMDFGPYYTYAEMMEKLDSLHAAYPELTSAKIDIGLSWEDRTIWAIRVSAGASEKEVLYTGVHHAREPIGCSICVDLIGYLCWEYEQGNPEIIDILDSCQLWFVPVVNPDGYVYNESLPSGMWRKNKRVDPGAVDLNRNYTYMWGYDDWGSSPNPGSPKYRGPSPGSEPEIQAMMEFCRQHNFFAALNYHSYGNYLLFSWGYDTLYTPDHEIFCQMADSMTSVNGYTSGTVWQVLYKANGGSDDWMYGDSTKPKIFSMSPEVGEYFWQPDTATINEQFRENLYMNLFIAKQAIAGIPEEPSKPDWLLKIYPNPFTKAVCFKYQVDKTATFVDLRIYDISGRLVRTIFSGQQMSGIHEISWTDRDKARENLSPGVYFCRLQVGQTSVTQKLIFLK